MREYVAGERRCPGQERQPAVESERFDAHDRVMPPIGTAISKPPGASHGVRAHAMSHSELEKATKGTFGRHSNNEALQNPNFRVGLHDPDKFDDRLTRHQAIRVKR